MFHKVLGCMTQVFVLIFSFLHHLKENITEHAYLQVACKAISHNLKTLIFMKLELMVYLKAFLFINLNDVIGSKLSGGQQ